MTRDDDFFLSRSLSFPLAHLLVVHLLLFSWRARERDDGRVNRSMDIDDVSDHLNDAKENFLSTQSIYD